MSLPPILIYSRIDENLHRGVADPESTRQDFTSWFYIYELQVWPKTIKLNMKPVFYCSNSETRPVTNK